VILTLVALAVLHAAAGQAFWSATLGDSKRAPFIFSLIFGDLVEHF
jgi:hypothetical protein